MHLKTVFLKHGNSCATFVCAIAIHASTLTACAGAPAIKETEVAAKDAFPRELRSAHWRAEDWVVEQMPGGTVRFEAERLVIEDKGGCTVWLKKQLEAPVRIRFKARVQSAGGPLDRVSDLNCFWMATDPAQTDGAVYREIPGRTGAFAQYDGLRCYYVGMGGNANTTTRFRRYSGGGEKPLLPEHDLQKPQFLLEGNREYLIEIQSTSTGIRYLRDGVVFFDWKDPAPLTRGYFGFRTVWSHLEIRSFEVSPLP